MEPSFIILKSENNALILYYAMMICTYALTIRTVSLLEFRDFVFILAHLNGISTFIICLNNFEHSVWLRSTKLEKIDVMFYSLRGEYNILFFPTSDQRKIENFQIDTIGLVVQ